MSAGTVRPGPGIRATFRAAPPAAKALLAGVFVNKLGAFVQVFLVLFLTTRGFSDLQAAVALGGYGAGSVVGVLAGGALTDRIGPRAAILTSMLGTAGFVLSILYLPSYPLVLLAVVVVAAVGQVYRPASATLLSELTPADAQVMIFAMYRLALNLGTTAAPLIGAVLLTVSYDLLFWGEAVAALGYAVIAAIALPRRAGGAAAGSPGAEPVAASAGQPGESYGAVLRDRRFVLFLISMLLNAAVYVQYLSTLPLAVTAAGLSVAWYGAAVALNGFLVITCELLVTKVVQNWTARYVIALAFALLGTGLSVYALPLGPAVFIVGTLIWTLAEIVGGPTGFAWPATAGPERLKGRYIGAAHAMFGLGSAIGPIAGVVVWNAAGPAMWLWCAVVCVAGAVAAWFGMRPRQPAPAPPPSPTGPVGTESVTAKQGA